MKVMVVMLVGFSSIVMLWNRRRRKQISGLAQQLINTVQSRQLLFRNPLRVLLLMSQLVEQLLSQAPPVAPGETVISSQLSAQLLAQLPLVAPGAASVLQEPQQSPLVAPGAASWLWVELQPARAKAAARVAAVKRVFIE